MVLAKAFSYLTSLVVLNGLMGQKIDECPTAPIHSQRNLSPYNPSLSKVKLRVAALVDKDYAHKMKVQYRNKKLYFVGGVSYEILLALQHSLDFNYIPIRETSWIGQKNGTLYGLTPKVIDGRADVAIAEASMIMLSKPKGRNHSKEVHYIDCISYLHPTSSTKLSVIFRQPDASSMSEIIFSTFSLNIWIAWVVVWGVIFLSIQLIVAVKCMRFEDRRVYYFHEDFVSSGEIGVLGRRDAVMWCFSLIAGHGWYEVPSCSTTRNVFLSALMFAYLVNIFFSAALTSHLALETVPIKSFENLVASKLILYGDRRLPYVRSLVQKILKIRRKKYSYSDVQDTLAPVKHMKDIVVNETAAFISFEDAVKSIKVWEDYGSQYFCEKMYSLSSTTQSFPNAMFVRKGSPLREIFNRKILVALERGVIHRIHFQYLRNTIMACEKMDHNYRGGLGVRDVFSAFSVLIGGMMLSGVALIFDKLMWSVIIRDN